MKKLTIFLYFLIIKNLNAQMVDASFFNSVRTINPGIIHQAKNCLVTADLSKEEDKKVHDVTLGGIVGGINTNVDLKKTDGFAAIRSTFLNTELLYDKTIGSYEQTINSTTHGNRVISDNATSNFFGAILDLYIVGVGYSTSNFSYLDEFRVDTIPNLVAHDEQKDLKYTNLKVGSAFSLSLLRFGFYYYDQSATGNYSYTYYDGTSGNKGSTETTSVKLKSKGLGAGIGFTLPKIRSELSYEKMYGHTLLIDTSYPGSYSTPSNSSRATFVGEVKIFSLGLGVRYRIIKGNFIDLNDIITSSLLYEKIQSSDIRKEISFNFSLGDSKGISPSAFYTFSKVTTSETSPVFDNGTSFEARTTTKAMGVSLSYVF
jgi:hypothetical protein